jgi:hypothetical protein
MIFTSNGTTMIVNMPNWGYTVSVVMGLHIAKINGGYSIWDDGSTYDYRILKMSRHLFTASEMAAVSAFFRDYIVSKTVTESRCEQFTMSLGGSPTGFFPAGPDKGDVGNFTCSLIGENQLGIANGSRFMFEDELQLKITPPSYSLPSIVSEGSFEIGSISSLRYPENGFKVERSLNHVNSTSRSGVVSYIDSGSSNDSWETSAELVCNYSNAASLVDYLIGTSGRSADISMVAPIGYYAFGIDKGSSGSYTAKLIQSEIEITHDSFDRFRIPLKFWRKS